ncbi:MAG: hypothetical protein JO127_09610 [Caulobacteraceae bacterium]|nr:hypothetical protein [Caulobacteraceae bacterium]
MRAHISGILAVAVLIAAPLRLAADPAQPSPAATSADILAYYPPAAKAAGIPGSAILDCARTEHGGLTGCTLVSEDPKGHGFGDAALAMSAKAVESPQVDLFPGHREPVKILFVFTPSPLGVRPNVLNPGWMLSLLEDWTQQSDGDERSRQLQAKARAFDAAAAAGDCDAALAEANQLTTSPEFPSFASGFQAHVWASTSICAFRKDRIEEAFEDIRHATDIYSGFDNFWVLRAMIAAAANHADDVQSSVARLSNAPASLSREPAVVFLRFTQLEVQAGDLEAVRAIYGVLEKNQYAPKDEADQLWLDYAQLEADAGQTAHALTLLGRVSTPRALIRARLDARFAAAVAADPAKFDVRAATERALVHDRAEAAAHPNLLKPAREAARDLMGLERLDEALALLKAVAVRAQSDPSVFADQAQELPRILDSEALALSELGRTDEALQTWQTGSNLGENGHANLADTLDFAEFLNFLGRRDAAATQLARISDEEASAAGPAAVSWVRAERICAKAGGGPPTDQDLAYLSGHSRLNPQAAVRALACLGRTDELAAALIADLQNPLLREDALVDLSDFDAPPSSPPGVEALLSILRTVRRRPDVQAALAGAGHTERFSLCQCAYSGLF